jgi:hypothetical protein
MFNIIGIALIAFGGLMVLLVLVRVARGARKWTPAEQRELSTGTMLRVATRELAAVRHERAAAGWTDDLLDRALSATRVAAAGAVGGAISQRTENADVVVGEGRLLTAGPRRGTKRVVSASATARDLTRLLARIPETDARRAALEALRDSLVTFTGAQYGRDATRNESALDDALQGATSAASTIRAQHVFPRTLLRRWTASRSPVESQA